MQSVLRSVAALALAALPLTAAAQDHCSRETLLVRGTPVTIGFCPAGPPYRSGGALNVPVDETVGASGGVTSTSQRKILRFITAPGPGRVIETVDLARAGLQGNLHLTLIFGQNRVSIESAMLTPGAITIK